MLLFRYLNASVMQATLAVTIILLLIVTSGRLAKYLSEASAGNLAADLVFWIILYRIPDFLPLIIPLGLFVGILLTYGRLYVDSEMTVLNACGTSKTKVLGITLLPAILVSTMVAGLTLWAAPASLARVQGLLEESRNAHGLALFREGKFQTDRDGRSVVYVKSLPSKRDFEQVLLVEQRRNGSIALVLAQRGEVLPADDPNMRYVKLIDGALYEGSIGSQNYQLTRFESYAEKIHLRREAEQVKLKIDALPTRQLFNSNKLAEQAALHWRFSLPTTVIVVAILAVPLSKTDRRKGRYTKMLPAILLYLVYIISLSGARSVVESGDYPPIALWLVHLAFLVFALLLTYFDELHLFYRSKTSSAGKPVGAA
ncbi:MAG: LPS export ABC transporter permease LptF [Gammaproteobacteria bacterium]|nr:LPS export ABC transporter permease LptF [Gammaproteobacteria bacterium]